MLKSLCLLYLFDIYQNLLGLHSLHFFNNSSPREEQVCITSQFFRSQINLFWIRVSWCYPSVHSTMGKERRCHPFTHYICWICCWDSSGSILSRFALSIFTVYVCITFTIQKLSTRHLQNYRVLKASRMEPSHFLQPIMWLNVSQGSFHLSYLSYDHHIMLLLFFFLNKQ